ncbi:hypothetical protein T08_1017 [Trichinella sp. T8]|nr:hypothetical protein T08_1178 [Trichinella sp. T8]KRZ91777.1 hypothetical protein T08_1017 [Trichinella sp. T8]
MAFFHASSRPRLFSTSRAGPDVYDFATTAEDTFKQMKSSGHDKHASMGSGQGFGQSVVLNVPNPEPADSRGRMQAGRKVRFHSQPQRQFFKNSNSAFFLTFTCSNSQNHFSNMDRCFLFANLINTISVINSHRWLGSFRGAVQLRHLSWSYAKANQLFMTGDQLSPTPQTTCPSFLNICLENKIRLLEYFKQSYSTKSVTETMATDEMSNWVAWPLLLHYCSTHSQGQLWLMLCLDNDQRAKIAQCNAFVRRFASDPPQDVHYIGHWPPQTTMAGRPGEEEEASR